MGSIQKLFENQWFHFSLSFTIGVLFVILRGNVIRMGPLENTLSYILIVVWGIYYMFFILNDYTPRFVNLIGLATGILLMYGIKLLFHL